ncbi:uncharacterized protein LOC116678980 [Etheostoma spectabile]|uniref:uncharacterized protein LOC116678980 n=1 Tax=Etheostoma spectabile TaxID=54343 RepID=UPI0013AF01CB|nr:uncharacterized protein LOC116678980 [Etheostoma spectabile]
MEQGASTFTGKTQLILLSLREANECEKDWEWPLWGSDLLSPKRRLESLSEDGSSDVDVLDLSPGTRLVKRPSQKKKRRKKTKNVEAMDGGSDLLSPKKRLEPLSGDGSSDGDVLDLSPGTRLVKRPSEKKKRREKTVEEMDGRSDLLSPKRRLEPLSEDGSSDVDVVDLSPGTRLMKRPSQKKKRRNKTKNVEAMVPPTVKVKDRGGKQRGVKVKDRGGKQRGVKVKDRGGKQRGVKVKDRGGKQRGVR